MASGDPLSNLSCSVVDLETTGASALYDRVIEIAVIRIEQGNVVDRFASLVDPRVPIPPFITRLTGISDGMVRGRPTFADIAPRVFDLLGGGPIVAHNASFDYQFLRHGLRRAGLSFKAPWLCTLRLARRLVPGLPSYRLDALARHLGIAARARHRAPADADTTAEVLRHLLARAAESGVGTLEELADLQQRPVTRRSRGVDESVLASLPAGPGVYLLKDADGHVVYVGKSIHVRRRVREHLRGATAGQPRLRRRLSLVADVEAFETRSELEALFLESRLIKRYAPEGNALQRNDRDYPFIKVDLADPFPTLEATLQTPGEHGLFFGPFRSRHATESVAHLLREHFLLRQCTGPLKPGQSACALLDLGKCSGPCVGAIDPIRYRAAAEQSARVLTGHGDDLVRTLVARRDQLAEELRFEEAARIRDRVRALLQILGAQRRLSAVADRNLAIVARSKEPSTGEIFIIRAGLLARQLQVKPTTRAATVQRALVQAFAGPPPAVTRERVDEMLLLDEWLGRRSEGARIVPVDPRDPAGALVEILAAIRPRLARPA